MFDSDPDTLLPRGPSTKAVFYKRWGVGRGMDCLEGGMHSDHEALFRCIEGVVIKANLVIVMGGVHADIPPDDMQGDYI